MSGVWKPEGLCSALYSACMALQAAGNMMCPGAEAFADTTHDLVLFS